MVRKFKSERIEEVKLKIEVKEQQEKKARLPEMGECWRHRNSSNIYMRISDATGARALATIVEGNFFSINLCCGDISAFPTAPSHLLNGIEILRGTLTLEVER